MVRDVREDFNCTVTSTWTNNENHREFHTWRAWGSRARKKQLDFFMGPKDIRSTTWYLNSVRFRTWDHFPVITKIEGRELKTKSVSRVGRDGRPSQKQRRPSSKNLCSVLDVTMTKPLCVRLKRKKD